MNLRFSNSVGVCGLFVLSAAAFAHHGTFVSYDTTKTFTTKATVTEFRYTNPHIQLFFDIKDEQGNVTHWSAEGPDPAVLVAVGWGRKKTIGALSPGAEITITISPARNGKPVAEMSNIVLANGDSVCGLSGARGGNCAAEAKEREIASLLFVRKKPWIFRSRLFLRVLIVCGRRARDKEPSWPGLRARRAAPRRFENCSSLLTPRWGPRRRTARRPSAP